MSQYPFFDTILPGEKNVLTFNFAPGLTNGNLLTGTPSVVVSCYSGTDPTPQGIVAGSLTIDSTGTKVYVPVAPALDQQQYLMLVTCPTGSTEIELICAAILPVSLENALSPFPN